MQNNGYLIATYVLAGVLLIWVIVSVVWIVKLKRSKSGLKQGEEAKPKEPLHNLESGQSVHNVGSSMEHL